MKRLKQSGMLKVDLSLFVAVSLSVLKTYFLAVIALTAALNFLTCAIVVDDHDDASKTAASQNSPLPD